MRAIALARPGCVATALLLLSCTRPNPAYEDTGGSGNGSGGSTGASTGASLSADETLGSASGSASGGMAVCGNGVVEGTEECDDGNLEDDGVCSPLCRRSGEVEWVSEFDPTGGGPDRFNASVLHGGDLVAVGRGVPEAGGPHRAVVVRYTRGNGNERSVGWIFEPWIESEAHAVAKTDDRLFISGPADRPDMTTTAFAACFEVLDPDEPPPPCWAREVVGTSSRAIAVIPSGVLVSVGHFNTAGHGLTLLDPQSGMDQWDWDVETGMRGGSQYEAIVRTNDGSLVAGMVDDQAIVAPVTQMAETNAPLFDVFGTGQGEDRVQTMAMADDDVVLGGWLDMAGSATDAWVGRYRLDGNERWSLTVDGGSDDSDEVEDLLIDGDGHVYAVGMVGEPSVATLWKFDGGSGMLLWSRSYPELGDGPSFFRNVELNDDLFVVGEVINGDNGVGLAMRIIP